MRRWGAPAPLGHRAGVLAGRKRFRASRALALSEKCAVLSESGDGDFSGEAPAFLPQLSAKLANRGLGWGPPIFTDSGPGAPEKGAETEVFPIGLGARF